MTRQPVKSSNIKAVGWEDSVLEVEYHAGRIYTYRNVPKEVHDDFMKATSPGKFLHSHIIGRYEGHTTG
jgi:hypothetical protein